MSTIHVHVCIVLNFHVMFSDLHTFENIHVHVHARILEVNLKPFCVTSVNNSLQFSFVPVAKT